jgi:hypothetical protein
MAVKGFKEARGKVIVALRNNNYAHEEERLHEKNYLLNGHIDVTSLIALLISCNGTQYTASPHHQVDGLTVHIFKPIQFNTRWYIKTYFLSDLGPLAEGDPDTMFISVHPSV